MDSDKTQPFQTQTLIRQHSVDSMDSMASEETIPDTTTTHLPTVVQVSRFIILYDDEISYHSDIKFQLQTQDSRPFKDIAPDYYKSNEDGFHSYFVMDRNKIEHTQCPCNCSYEYLSKLELVVTDY